MSPMLAATLTLAVLTVTPGPDVAVVTRAALSRGLAHAFRTASGIITGLLAWGLLTVAGLAALLAASATAYTAVKLLGAAYLVWLGVQSLWRSRRSEAGDRPSSHQVVDSRPWRTGFVTNILNPKIAVFYTGLLPQLVPAGAPEVPGLVALVVLHAVLSLAFLGGYSVVVTRFAACLQRPRVRRALDAVTGLALVGFGVRVVASGRRL